MTEDADVATRKLVAIMFTDIMVDYTALAQSDEEQALRAGLKAAISY